MVKTNEFFHLTYLGRPYHNKPPLFFWLLAASTACLGESELALRLPATIFALGTKVLTYRLAGMLFSCRAGVWAALAATSTLVFLWYGRRVLLDSA